MELYNNQIASAGGFSGIKDLRVLTTFTLAAISEHGFILTPNIALEPSPWAKGATYIHLNPRRLGPVSLRIPTKTKPLKKESWLTSAHFGPRFTNIPSPPSPAPRPHLNPTGPFIWTIASPASSLTPSSVIPRILAPSHAYLGLTVSTRLQSRTWRRGS